MHKNIRRKEIVACAKIEDIIFSVAKASPCSVTESGFTVDKMVSETKKHRKLKSLKPGQGPPTRCVQDAYGSLQEHKQQQEEEIQPLHH